MVGEEAMGMQEGQMGTKCRGTPVKGMLLCKGLGGRKRRGLPESQTAQAPGATLQSWMAVQEPRV